MDMSNSVLQSYSARNSLNAQENAVLAKLSAFEFQKVFASFLRQNCEFSTTREICMTQPVRQTNNAYNEQTENLAILEKEGIITNDYQVKANHGKIIVITLIEIVIERNFSKRLLNHVQVLGKTLINRFFRCMSQL